MWLQERTVRCVYGLRGKVIWVTLATNAIRVVFVKDYCSSKMIYSVNIPVD